MSFNVTVTWLFTTCQRVVLTTSKISHLFPVSSNPCSLFKGLCAPCVVAVKFSMPGGPGAQHWRGREKWPLFVEILGHELNPCSLRSRLHYPLPSPPHCTVGPIVPSCCTALCSRHLHVSLRHGSLPYCCCLELHVPLGLFRAIVSTRHMRRARAP